MQWNQYTNFLKKTKICEECGHVLNYPVEKGCDVNLAVDMMSMAYKNLYDVAILVSADGDFASACQCVKDLGKHIEIHILNMEVHGIF